jgi:hypothetical protein
LGFFGSACKLFILFADLRFLPFFPPMPSSYYLCPFPSLRFSDLFWVSTSVWAEEKSSALLS